MAARQRPLQLFGPSDSPERGALPWNTADWTAVDDRVRGGSSTSQVALVNHNGDPAPQGELKFSGYLDTTTLGGAGFASQRRAAYPPFPFTLTASAVSGITIRIRDRHVPSFDLPHPRRADPQHGNNDLQIQESIQNAQPGGGQAPVKTFNLNFYTSRPKKRQEDDRMEASVVYEGTFNVSNPTAVYPVSVGEPPGQRPDISSDPVGAAVNMTYGPPTIYESISEYTLLWNAFHATYRGRPVPDAEPLDPSQIVNWSLMARSNFAEQSGPFALQLNSIWTVPSGNDTPEPQHPHAKRSADTVEVHRRSINDILTPDHITGSPGFALYVFATLLLVAWLLWAITPDALLKKLGVSWYPNREWAFLLPSFSLLVVLLAYIVYMAINLTMTPSLEDLSTVVDEHTNPPLVKRAGDMTFKEAEEYYKHQHPYGPGGNRRDMGGAMG